MNTEEFISLNEHLGNIIIRTDKYSWIIRENNTALSFPTLESVFPSCAEIQNIFKSRIKMVFFKTEISEKNCYEYMYQGNNCQLEVFDSKTRNQIRKGLKSCSIRNASITELIEKGLSINRQTLGRQEREDKVLLDQSLWENYISTLHNARDVYIKGAYVGELLVAYIVFIKVEDKYYIYHPFMNREYSSYCPMNAILFSFINEIIQLEGKIKISYGLSSYAEKQGLDRFKKNMGFQEVPCSRVLAISPQIAPFINSVGYGVLKLAVRIKLVNQELLAKYKILLDSKEVYKKYIKERQ